MRADCGLKRSGMPLRLVLGTLGAVLLTNLVPAANSQAASGHVQTYRTLRATSHSVNPAGSMLRPRNVRPKPDFTRYCGSHSPNSPHCIALELAAIRHARSAQGFAVRPMVLPRNYQRLSYARQLFVLTNLERVDRGLHPIRGLTAALNRRSRVGAAKFDDPYVGDRAMQRLRLRSWRSLWAEDLGPLAADYDWMYDDGFTSYGPRIIDCGRPHAPGCWGHRDNILAHLYGSVLLAGAASAYPCALSVAVLISAGKAGRQPLSYSWHRARRSGAGDRITPALRDRAHRVA